MTKKHYTHRQYRVAAGLLLALSAPALAQVPPLNLPGLPLPPGVSNPASGSTAATPPADGPPPLNLPAPKAEEKTADAPKSINPTDMLPPELLGDAAQPTPPESNTADAEKASDNKNETAADGTKPAAQAPSEQAAAEDSEDAGPPPPMPFGGTPAIANATATPPAGGALAGPPLPPGAIDMGELAGDDTAAAAAAAERKKLKSWEKPLAPSRTYLTTKFKYKRVVLPASVYRTQYPAGNGHLPKRLTREDLDKAFLIAVAKNDVNGTRALLDSGRNVNQMNAFGDSALIVAVRAGAFDTARLLVARGANTGFYGQGGKTAFHYARQWKNNDLAKMLIKGS